MSERAKAITTLIVAVATVGNVALQAIGWSPLPVDESQVYAAVSAILAVVATLYAWWKNNNITEAAQDAQKVLDELKAGE